MNEVNEAAITHYIGATFEGIDTVTANGNTFFFYDPDHMFPFATLVTDDSNDQFSNLNRPSVFRLNIGIGKQTYRSLFGAPAEAASAYDFTVFDTIMPHPVYGKMYWICILNPSPATFDAQVRPLLAEAYELAVAKRMRHASRA